MTAALSVTTDHAGVERFAFELFCQAGEDAFPTSRRPLSRLTDAALNPSRIQEKTESPEEPRLFSRGRSPIPLAYQLWLAHLLWLEEVLHTLDCRPSEISSAELSGLQAVARARARFLSTHQLCPHCQAVNPRAGAQPSRCHRCSQEF